MSQPYSGHCNSTVFQVIYTLGTKVQVKVHAEVVNPMDETRETTNDFYFTFNTRSAVVPTVIPKSYAGKNELYTFSFCFFVLFQNDFWAIILENIPANMNAQHSCSVIRIFIVHMKELFFFWQSKMLQWRFCGRKGWSEILAGHTSDVTFSDFAAYFTLTIVKFYFIDWTLKVAF